MTQFSKDIKEFRCLYCNQPIAESTKFCGSCGKKLEEIVGKDKNKGLKRKKKKELEMARTLTLDGMEAVKTQVNIKVEVDEAGEVKSQEDISTRPCPKCGQINGATHLFCGQCKQPMESLQICSFCYAENPLNVVYCAKCGNRICGDTNQTYISTLESRTLIAAKLMLITESGLESQEINLGPEPVTIGRIQGNHRFENDAYLSPLHAQLTIQNNSLFITDLDSLNGIFFKIRKECRLEPGSVFMIGNQVLKFEYINFPIRGVDTINDGTRLLGSPDYDSLAKLIQIAADQNIRNVYHVTDKGVFIGRERGDIIFNQDSFISAAHAKILFKDKLAYLIDLNSSNGTWIKLPQTFVLSPNDFVIIGKQLFKVQIHYSN